MQHEGEFWIISGAASYADGDIGEMNHEGYVIEHAQSLVADALGKRFEAGWDDWEAFLDSIESEDLEALDVPAEAFAIANNESNADARGYAIREWGWKRLCDDSVETWAFSRQDADEILDGLYDAYDFVEEDLQDAATFSIHVWATGRSYYLSIADLTKYAETGRLPEEHDPIDDAAAALRQQELAAMPTCYDHVGD